MRAVSLFSGIESAGCAWRGLPIDLAAVSEVDPFCCAVLARRFPEAPNLLDAGCASWKECRGADIVVAGSPCQSFSIAGKREGMRGTSSSVAHFIRAVAEILPRLFIWENVPGVLTSNRGADFRWILMELDAVGYGMAWRVLDARAFGLPQRRPRLFLVGSLGCRRAEEIFAYEEDMLEAVPAPYQERGARVAHEGPQAASREVIQISGSVLGRSRELTLGICSPDERGAYTCTATDVHALAMRIQEDGTERVILRHMTPWEYERCQGLPDGWTDLYGWDPDEKAVEAVRRSLELNRRRDVIPGEAAAHLLRWCANEEGHTPDYLRCRAIGNAMAVPVMRWIGERACELS